VKRGADIAWAHGLGIDLFAADAEEELVKLARFAPGARVYLRLLIEHSEADWPLGRKFGCAPEEALRLIGLAWNLGLRPAGLSFHVGSQTREAAMWGPALDVVAGVWREARSAGFALDLLNIGGGFPAFYGDPVQEAETSSDASWPSPAGAWWPMPG
jgi:ornithine decarboxylase